MRADLPFTEEAFDDWIEVKRRFEKFPSAWIFRGQSQKKWCLLSSLDREAGNHKFKKKDIETFLLFQFKRRAHDYLDSLPFPDDELEWLALMQHHGAPTRLLDFTRSPYVASFFALENATGECAVWAVDKDWCRDQAIPLISQLLKDSSQTYLKQDLGNPMYLRNSFPEIFLQPDLRMVYAVEPYRMSERLTVQQGCFLCPGDLNLAFEENLFCCDPAETRPHVTKMVLDREIRQVALLDLYLMNINRASLFPGIDGFAQSLKHQLFSPAGEQLARIMLENFINSRMRKDPQRLGQSTLETPNRK